MKNRHCIDCGKEIKKYKAIRCKSCAHKGERSQTYKDGRCLKKYHCTSCGKKVSIGTGVYGHCKCRSCISKYLWNSSRYRKLHSKENASNWQGGGSFEPYPLGWTRKLRKHIRKRDNYICQICGRSELENKRKLSVHHVDYNKNNLNPLNLISLCVVCHSKVNYNRKDWTMRFKKN